MSITPQRQTPDKSIILILNILCILSVLSVLFVFSCTNNKNLATLPEEAPKIQNQPEQAPVDAKKQTENPQPKESFLRFAATIKAEQQSTLSFQSQGVLTKVFVKSGQFVEKNASLAQLNDSQAEFAVKNAQSEVKSKQLALDQGKKRILNMQEQLQLGVISQNFFDNEKLIFENLKLDVEKARIDLKSKQVFLDQTQLKAPYSGIISKVYKSIGDSVSPGIEIFELVSQNNLNVFSQIPVNYYARIKVGQKLTVQDPMTHEKWDIIIKRIVPVIDSAKYTFDVYGAFEKTKTQLITGRYIEILLPE